VWVPLAIVVNLGLLASIALMAMQGMEELEQRLVQRIEMTAEAPNPWQGELAAARSELIAEMAELRGELTVLQQEVSTDDGDLRGDLDALSRRLSRVESMVTVLWQAPGTGPGRG
jgi:signal transduction histidine kinase